MTTRNALYHGNNLYSQRINVIAQYNRAAQEGDGEEMELLYQEAQHLDAEIEYWKQSGRKTK